MNQDQSKMSPENRRAIQAGKQLAKQAALNHQDAVDDACDFLVDALEQADEEARKLLRVGIRKVAETDTLLRHSVAIEQFESEDHAKAGRAHDRHSEIVVTTRLDGPHRNGRGRSVVTWRTQALSVMRDDDGRALSFPLIDNPISVEV